MNFEKKEEHESYALASFSRISSSGNHNLFGSSIKHSHTITLSISKAERHRDLNREWYFPRQEIIEVEMSQNQFAELISSLNCGSGVPCTLRRHEGRGIEDPPYHNQRHLFENEFKEKTQQVGERLSSLATDLQQLLDEKAPKRAFREFVERVRMTAQEVNSNMPFVQSSFNEAMDKTVVEAKGEVESFVLNRVTSLGIEALKDQAPQIENSSKKESA